MPRYFIYIPFANNRVENGQYLYQQAIAWRNRMLESGSCSKAPTIITHGKDTFKDVEEGSAIYILGHCPPNTLEPFSNMIVNKYHADQPGPLFYFSMETVANRIQAAGLTPAMKARIKLYVCDERNIAAIRAGIFTFALNPEFRRSSTSVDFYPSILLSSPLEEKNKSAKIYKRAVRYCSTASAYLAIGKSKEFRKRILLGSPEDKKASTEASDIEPQVTIIEERKTSLCNPVIPKVAAAISSIEESSLRPALPSYQR